MPSVDQPSPSPNVLSEAISPPEDRSREQLERLRFEPPPVDFTDWQVLRDQDQHVGQPSPYGSSNQTVSEAVAAEHGRKRSFSVAEGTHGEDSSANKMNANRLSSISSILNPPPHLQQNMVIDEDLPLDPNLSDRLSDNPNAAASNERASKRIPAKQRSDSSLPQQIPRFLPGHQSESPSPPNQAAEDPYNRKARLRREAEDLREMLEAKERELKELG